MLKSLSARFLRSLVGRILVNLCNSLISWMLVLRHIRLEIPETESADFDFTGIHETFNYLNTRRAIVHSAIIYGLRVLIDVNIPLNHGCLAPVSVIVPSDTLLNLAKHVAVCAGSPITSQHSGCCDRGFGAYAASQDCFNIISFGMEVPREYLW